VLKKISTKSISLHLLLIIVFGLIAYSNTFDVPFQWDDLRRISGNEIVKDLSYFTDTERASALQFHDALKGRYVGYLTFALNYKINGLDVRGYHILNTAIHLITALLVYFFVILIFKTPFLSRSSLSENSRYAALFACLLFVSHPVQTEAVTYIFQRLASLAALFCLASLVLYALWRLKTGQPDSSGVGAKRLPLYLASLISAVLAMKTKEIAFTLPLIIALYELLFFTGSIKRRFLYLAPFLLTMLIIPLSILGTDRPLGEIIQSIGPATSSYKEFTRGEYLFTELRVVVTYLRLLFMPIEQNIDYDYPIYSSLFTPQVLLSFLFLASVFVFSLYLFFRSKARPELRLLAFGMLWFFITLSVESSVIPIPMVINEYRMYLPSAGAFMAIAAAALLLFQRIQSARLKTAFIAAMVVIPVILASTTYARNSVWKSEISLWEDVVRKSPMKARGHAELGAFLVDKGFVERGIAEYAIVLKLDPFYDRIHYNLGTAYIAKGQYETAVTHLQRELSFDYGNSAAHHNLGYAYMKLGELESARREFEIAVGLDPNNHIARQYLSYIKRALQK
jgi:tetratricopeptide (TPR) repeat protein